jgi:flagellar basal-body rod modification protein FlgD
MSINDTTTASTVPVTPNSADTITGSGSNVTRTTGGNLGKDDFLKLMVAQMSHMDPLSQDGGDPSKSTEQMTQFSILEQLTNLSQATQGLAQQNQVSSTVALLGKSVSYSQDDGSTATGTITSVQTAGGKTSITIGDTPGIDPNRILEVK